MKRWFLGAVLVILVVAFGFLTQGVHKSSLTEDQEQQMAQDAQKAQEAKAKQAAAKPPAATPGSTSSATEALPDEEIVGDPATARHHIEVGWVYGDTDVVNSDKLKAALAQIRTFAQKSGGTVSAVLVDLDVPVEDRSPAAQGVVNLGIEADGTSVSTGNPAEAPPGTLIAALGSAIKP